LAVAQQHQGAGPTRRLLCCGVHAARLERVPGLPELCS
jgi:hypothetical protein